MKSIFKNLFLKFNIGKKILVLFFANFLFLSNIKFALAQEIIEYKITSIPERVDTQSMLFSLSDLSDEDIKPNFNIEVKILLNDVVVETKKIKTQFEFFKLDLENYLGKSGLIQVEIKSTENDDLNIFEEFEFDLTDLIRAAKLELNNDQISTNTFSINWDSGKNIDSYNLHIDVLNNNDQLIESRKIETSSKSYLLNLDHFMVKNGLLKLKLISISNNKFLSEESSVSIPFDIKTKNIISNYKSSVKFNSITRSGQGNEFNSVDEYNKSGDEVFICINNNDRDWISIDQKRNFYKAYWLLDIDDILNIPNCLSEEVTKASISKNTVEKFESITLGAEIYSTDNKEMNTIKSIIKFNSNTFISQNATSNESNKFKNKGEVVDACVENGNNYWIRISRDEQLYKAYWLLNNKVEEFPSCYP